MKKPIKILILIVLIVCLAILVIIVLEPKAKYYMNLGVEYVRNIRGVKVPNIHSKSDKNSNGISDPIDIVTSSRIEAENKTKYKDAYYVGGYPPENEGVCTDVVWRGFKGMGIDLKALVDKDIKNNAAAYPRVAGKPDPNIDFRRVRNLDVFFKRNAISVTKELIPFDVENLKEWQPGDIVIIMEPFEHIAIVSDKRSKNGVPYVIHNTSPHAVENGSLIYWAPYIYGHYRWRF